MSATGNWRHPCIPNCPGGSEFMGRQLRPAAYLSATPFAGRRVLVVGGNSGAQVLAEVLQVAETAWVTDKPPHFLPDDVDGRALFERFTPRGVQWVDGNEAQFDAVIWCTGFRPALAHLAPLNIVNPAGRVDVEGTRSTVEPRPWLVGYGDWTGMASATRVGVMRTARSTAHEIDAFLPRQVAARRFATIASTR